MSFEVARQTSCWAHIALCADVTWTTEPPDEFIIANQRLWAQHCRITQALQEADYKNSQIIHQCESTTEKSQIVHEQDSGGNRKLSVKDVIPESRLAQYYGNFFYDESREKCYTSSNESPSMRSYNGQNHDTLDLTECWMLPEVEYWFRRLTEEQTDRCSLPRRRRQLRMLTVDDLERCEASGGPRLKTTEEESLAAKIHSVRGLWAPRSPSPPETTRKMRARRRQCRKTNLQPPLTYRLDATLPLVCDPNCKFNLPRLQLAERQRAIGRITANLQAAMRSSMARCLPYRGTNVSRYTPTSQRPKATERRHNGVWQKEQSPRADTKPSIKSKNKELNKKGNTKSQETTNTEKIEENEIDKKESNECIDDQEPSTSKACADMGLQKRLYSTVLSMNPIGQVGARLTQKLITPGILKLNPKILLPRLRQTNVDSRFEELEKQALEQYKGSDESIDTKFQELEKQAEEQYSNSNSNTSCSSAEKKPSESSAITERSIESQKSKSVDSVVVYSQKYPELKLSTTSIGKRLKNVHSPLRGESKDLSKVKIMKNTDKKENKIRWISHILPPKKRHDCMTDFSSDEEFDGCANSPCDVCDKRKVKMSAHGGGDLKNIMMRNS